MYFVSLMKKLESLIAAIPQITFKHADEHQHDPGEQDPAPSGLVEMTPWADGELALLVAFLHACTRVWTWWSSDRPFHAGAGLIPDPRLRPVGLEGRCSSAPGWMISAVDSGISSHAPGRSPGGSETTTRSSSVNCCRRGLSGCSLRSASACSETNRVRDWCSVE